MRSHRYLRIAIAGALFLTTIALAFALWVNGSYAFTPDTISEFNFVLVETQTSDGWTDRTFVCGKPISEVRQAFITEMETRGYVADITRYQGWERIGFARAGWSKAYLVSDPDDVMKTCFTIIETDEFIKRALIVLGILT